MYHGYSFDYFVAQVDSLRNQGGYDRADLIMKFLLKRRHLAPSHLSTLYIPDAKKGEQLVLVTTNPQATREEVVAHAKASYMREISIPKKILILTKMPLLGSGKIDYLAVKKYLVENSSP